MTGPFSQIKQNSSSLIRVNIQAKHPNSQVAGIVTKGGEVKMTEKGSEWEEKQQIDKCKKSGARGGQ